MTCLADFKTVSVEGATVFHGSNLDVLPFMADNSVDSIVTDPPYELGFMGKKWDSSGIAYSVELWRECLRVLKPGGHLLAFGGSRTWHRLAVAIEDAGFEVRDSIAWLYGSGFPKSHDISKAIDKAAGAEREIVGKHLSPAGRSQALTQERSNAAAGVFAGDNQNVFITAPATPEAQKWAGWGTALKPAFEPVVVARKPLIGTVAENVLTWGVGGLNIDASRIGTEERVNQPAGNKANSGGVYNFSNDEINAFNGAEASKVTGRWPANIVLDEYTAGLLDEQADASRFFYVAKASKKDRNEGLDGMPIRRPDERTETGMETFAEKGVQPAQNFHPTVKPTTIMEYLIKLVTPPNGVVLDPFTGSGSTGKAALLNGYQFVGIELTDEYLPIIEGRLKWAIQQNIEATEKETEKLF